MDENSEYILNNYKMHKFRENEYLLTTESGSWSLITGKEFGKLRNGNLERGSDLYKQLEERGLILNEDNVENEVKRYALKNHFLYTGPSLHIITPTMRCNQRCLYCHSEVPGPNNSGKYDLKWDVAKEIIDFSMKSNSDVLKYEFQGGEPLLNYDIIEKIIDYTRDVAGERGKEVSFMIVSNLTSLDGEILESLKKRDVEISTSLDGPKKIHNENRKYIGGNNTYDDLVKNIEKLRNNKINVNALSTITKSSLKNGRDIVDEYLDRGFDNIWLRPMNRIGFARERWEKIGYSPEEFLNFYKNTMDYILEEKNGEIRELMAVLFAKKILGTRDPEMTELMSPCGAGISQLLYDNDGDIYTCDEGKIFDEFKLGNVRKSQWNDIFKNETLLSMIDVSSKQSLLCDRCEWEAFCGICPVNTYSLQGTIISELPRDFNCRIYGKIIENVFERLLYSKKQRKIIQGWAKNDRVFG